MEEDSWKETNRYGSLLVSLAFMNSLFSISILTFIRLLHLSAFLFSFPGGKPDDITVIVGQVVSSSNN